MENKMIMRGNFCPDGAVAKITGATHGSCSQNAAPAPAFAPLRDQPGTVQLRQMEG